MNIIDSKDPNAVKHAAKILSDGGIIVYPTDTLYGLGVDATKATAIDRLNQIKERVGPVSVIAPNIETAITWMNIELSQIDLVPFYLGGAKTLIVKVRQGLVSPKILGDNNTLGIRVPNNAFCNSLSAYYAKPITTTSVNITGEDPLNSPKEIEEKFSNGIDLLVNEGTLPVSSGSTIYKLNKNSTVTVVRE